MEMEENSNREVVNEIWLRPNVGSRDVACAFPWSTFSGFQSLSNFRQFPQNDQEAFLTQHKQGIMIQNLCPLKVSITMYIKKNNSFDLSPRHADA